MTTRDAKIAKKIRPSDTITRVELKIGQVVSKLWHQRRSLKKKTVRNHETNHVKTRFLGSCEIRTRTGLSNKPNVI